MRFGELAGVDYDGARYCLACAPVSAEQAEDEGLGGAVLAGQDTTTDDVCDTCRASLED